MKDEGLERGGQFFPLAPLPQTPHSTGVQPGWARGRWEVGTRAGGPPADSIGRLLGTKVEGQTTEVFSGFLRRGTQTAGGIPGTQVVGDPRFWRAEMGLFL